jgi:hypothetical protein
MSSEQARMKSKARRSDEAGFGAIGGQFHVCSDSDIDNVSELEDNGGD